MTKEVALAKTDFKAHDEYIATFSPEDQRALQTIRRTVKDALPEAEEVISYQMPAFRLHGIVLWYGAFSSHYSVFAPSVLETRDGRQVPVAAFRDRITPDRIIGKSGVRLAKDEPLPLDLVADIARYAAAINLARASAKTPARGPQKKSAGPSGL